MTSDHWPSLAPQIALAERLFGPRGNTMLQAWLDEQIERIADPNFARLFSDHIELPGIAAGDYNHRIVRTANGQLLGGIRFYGRDVARPFVEVVAHDFSDWAALQHCVEREQSDFTPQNLRTLVATDAALPQDAHVDMTIYAARYGEMAKPDGRVSLTPFGDAEKAVAMAIARYAELAEAEPALAHNISMATPEDIWSWHDEDQLRAIQAEIAGIKEVVGFLAAVPGAVEWIEGDVMQEKVVLADYCRQGLATSAQKSWAARAEIDSSRLLVGTIKDLNVASRRSAVRAGRPALLDYAFLPIRGGR